MEERPNLSLTLAVAELLAEAKASTGATWDSLVRDTGLSESSVRRYVGGQRSINLDELERLCRPLQLDPVAVLALADARRKARVASAEVLDELDEFADRIGLSEEDAPRRTSNPDRRTGRSA